MPEKSIKVLLVSPDDSVFRFFSMLFRDTRYSLIKAAEGVTALDEVKRSDPAMVLLDIDRLPGVRLMDLCRILAENPRPVLLVSHNTERTRQTVVKGMGIGAVDILAIPDGAPSLSQEQKLRLMRSINTSVALRVSPISYGDALSIVESVSREAGEAGGTPTAAVTKWSASLYQPAAQCAQPPSAGAAARLSGPHANCSTHYPRLH